MIAHPWTSIFTLFFLAGLCSGCVTGPSSSTETTILTKSVTPAPSPVPLPTTTAPTLSTTAVVVTATMQTAIGKIKIFYGGNAMVELISPEGTRVMIDVYNPAGLSAPANTADILLTTHTHGDHINNDFLKTFPGKQLFVKAGELQAQGVKILGIAAGHNSADKPLSENGTDYIFLIEMGRMRIAHFGDIGQDALTPEQLSALGKIDLAVMQFENSYSAMDTTNQKGFTMMNQLKPKLIIPTHIAQASVKLIGEKYKTIYSEQAFIMVGAVELAGEPRVIFLGSKAKTWGDVTKAEKVNW